MPEPAALAETHTSVVVFVGERAYKLKKPVSLAFLDFSTREARERACHHEVELNRRLAPDVYLGVADVFDPDGRVCDHLVVMRRLPPERRLSSLVTRGEVTDADVDALAHLLAAFHTHAPTSPEIAAAASRDAVRARWEQSFEQLRPFVGPLLDEVSADRVEHLAREYLEGRRPLFDERVARGWARDGHGDLLADDVFLLDDGPRVLDCIEFDDRLRYGDVLEDVSFLAMDLQRLGAARLADRFVERWSDGLGEAHPASLGHHYRAYRAHVRCKVAALRAAQGHPPASDDAHTHLALAASELEAGRIALVVVGGAPGTGKSTLAEAIGAARSWTVLRSDAIRKELLGVPADADATTFAGPDAYSEETTERVYALLLERAGRALSLGETVVADASWTRAAHRAAATRVASATHSELVELRCDVPPDVAAARVTRRTERFASDADEAVARALATAADAWPSATRVDTTGDPSTALEAALRLVPPRGG